MPEAEPTPDPSRPPAPAPDAADGHDTLKDASDEAVREIEKRHDGSGGYSGEGDIG
jgi:hypothetical protein